MSQNHKDREILRDLAQQVAEIAALPAQQETIRLWKSLNGLKPVRPMVMIDQMPWHEMDVANELTLRTEDPFCRGLETPLRRSLYLWRHMRVDMVVQPLVTLGKAIRNTGFGIRTMENVAVTDPRNSVVGHAYIDQLKTDQDVEKIRTPEVSHDEAATARTEARVHELFDGILSVRMQGALPGFAPWDAIVQWRSPEGMFLDLADRPEFMHRIMSRFTDAQLAMLDQLEAKGLLGYDQPTIHCTGAFTDDLPAPEFDPRHPRARDLWTSGQAQIFSGVSPAMHQEFELNYANRWYSRFGLVYYGCCEPLDRKIGIIRNIPHVRKISISPRADIEQAAAEIGPDFVFSRKPNPAFLAGDKWDPAFVERDLQQVVETCRRHGCPVEFILKDISTVCYQPDRLWQWADIAMRVANGT